MASVQICRFQRRVTNLHAHHESSLKRHSVADKNYLSRSRDIMNSLLSNLSDEDKKLKKSKRICRVKKNSQPLSKSARFTELAGPLPCQTSYNGFASAGSEGTNNASETFLQPTSTLAPRRYTNSDLFGKQTRLTNPATNRYEPVFPPTYDEPLCSSFNTFPSDKNSNEFSSGNPYSSFPQTNRECYFSAPSTSVKLNGSGTINPGSGSYSSPYVQCQSDVWPQMIPNHVYPNVPSYQYCQRLNVDTDRLFSSGSNQIHADQPLFEPSVYSPRTTSINPILAFTYPTYSVCKQNKLQCSDLTNFHQTAFLQSRSDLTQPTCYDLNSRNVATSNPTQSSLFSFPT